MLILYLLISVGIALIVAIAVEIFKKKQEFPLLVLELKKENLKQNLLEKQSKFSNHQNELIYQKFSTLQRIYEEEIKESNLKDFWVNARKLNQSIVNIFKN